MEEDEVPRTMKEASSLVDECVDKWDAGGSSQVLQVLASTLSDAVSSSTLLPGTFFSVLHTLFASVVFRSRLSSSTLANLLRDLIQCSLDANADAPSTSTSQDGSARRLVEDAVLDTVWTVDSDVENGLAMATGEGKSEEQKELAKSKSADQRNVLVGLVKELMSKEIVSEMRARERLEVSLLRSVGLIADETAFNRRTVQINTSMLYKQRKFNLLREESEGFSKLATELVTNMGPPLLAFSSASSTSSATTTSGAGLAEAESPPRSGVREQESAEERMMRAKGVMNNISSLIGYFDLDPNRVLDVILNVFSCNLFHYPFFLDLLTVSPWGRARLARSDAMEADDADKGKTAAPHHVIDDESLSLSYDVGDSVCGQTLGFKMAYYQSPEVAEDVPEQLYLLAALLIREGFVRMVDLYPHLSPSDEDMVKLQGKYKDALADKAMAARSNALSMAAPLLEEEDGAVSSDPKAAGTATPAKEPPNQKVGLLKALLAVGDLRHALFVLGQYPFLCGLYPEIADLFLRLLNVTIEPVYQSISLASRSPRLNNPALGSPRQRYSPTAQGLVAYPSPTPTLTLKAPEPSSTISAEYLFFYPRWRVGLPTVSAGRGVLEVVKPLLKVLGVHMYRDVRFMTKLCRIGRAHLVKVKQGTPEEERVRSEWLQVIRLHILPALSLLQANPGLVNEVWNFIRFLPYQVRYSLYGEWKYSLYKKHPELRVRSVETEKEAKSILRRISKDNVKQFGRTLAKVSHSNPLVLFSIALNQVQAYENLVAPVVDTAKYLTQFGYDVLTFAVIEGLSNPEKDRTKQDGTNLSQWLQSLAGFTGTVFRRYAMMDPSTVLEYVVNQLKTNNSKDLIIIRELILKMTGIESISDLSDDDIAALAGGKSLRQEALMSSSAAADKKPALRRAGMRLLRALDESRLAIPLLVLVAQQRQACVHLVPEPEAHLKYLGNLFDSCQAVLFQYVDFLTSFLEPGAYASLTPSIRDLCLRFGIEPSIAFHINRPKLVHAMKTSEMAAKVRAAAEAEAAEKRLKESLKASKQQQEKEKKEGGEGKAEAEAEAETEADKMEVEGATVAVKTEGHDNVAAEPKPKKEGDEAQGTDKQDQEAEMKDVAATEAKEGDTDAAEQVRASPAVKEEGAEGKSASPVPPVEAAVEAKPVWHSGLADVIDMADEILPESVRQSVGSAFFVTFWQLSLYDISVPMERYRKESDRLSRLVRQLDAEYGSDPSKKTAREKLLSTIKTLNDELKGQTLGYEATRRRLNVEKEHWFSKGSANRGEIVKNVVQYCVQPRAMLSPLDAMFSAKFIKTMHSIGTANFSSLKFYDTIFGEQIGSILFSCTEKEASNYARFLHDLLADLHAWHAKEEVFQREAIGKNLPGFRAKWAPPTNAMVTWEQFPGILAKWHRMMLAGFLGCLDSREHMHIRNAIVALNRIEPFFPAIDQIGERLIASVQRLSTEEKREDLKIMATGYLAKLKRKQEKLPTFDAFRHIRTPQKPLVAAGSPAPAAKGSSAPSATPASPDTKAASMPSAAADAGQADESPASKGDIPSAAAQGDQARTSAPPSTPGVRATIPLPPRPSFGRNDRSERASREPPREPRSERRADENAGPDVSTAETSNDGQDRPSAPTTVDTKQPSIPASAAAARQLVLDSMNPPSSPANTRDAQAVRERERDREKDREKDGKERALPPKAPPSQHSSANGRSHPPSPRSTSPSRRSSRHGSVDSTHSRARESEDGRRRERDRERERESGSCRNRERERERDREKEKDRDRAREREGDARRDDRSRGSERERGKRPRESGHDERARDGGGRRGERDDRHGRGERDRDWERERYKEKEREREKERPRERDREAARRVSGDVSSAPREPRHMAEARRRGDPDDGGNKRRRVDDRGSARESMSAEASRRPDQTPTGAPTQPRAAAGTAERQLAPHLADGDHGRGAPSNAPIEPPTGPKASASTPESANRKRSLADRLEKEVSAAEKTNTSAEAPSKRVKINRSAKYAIGGGAASPATPTPAPVTSSSGADKGGGGRSEDRRPAEEAASRVRPKEGGHADREEKDKERRREREGDRDRPRERERGEEGGGGEHKRRNGGGGGRRSSGRSGGRH